MCDGGEIPWADIIHCLGVFIIRAAKFKCSTDKAKRSFYRAANGISAKIGRLASEEVMVQLSSRNVCLFCCMLWMYATWTKDQCNHWTLHLIYFL